jgi:hypothetical protein
MDLSTQPNILNKNVFPNFLSENHVLYYPEVVGLIQATGREAPNINTYQRMGAGVNGVSKFDQTFTDQPFSFSIEYDEPMQNRFMALFTDQNPDDAESTVSGSDMIITGGAIGINTKFDVVENQTDQCGENFVKSSVLIDCQQTTYPTTIPNEGSGTIEATGTCKRQYDNNKPAMAEGWGHTTTVAQQTVPDDTVLVGKGAIWLARDPASYTGTPRKGYYKGGTPIVAGLITPVVANDKYVAIIAYETSKNGYTDIAWTVLDGAENATPVKLTDTEIEAAVDAISSGARWCCIAQILVDEIGAGPVVINTADINLQELPGNTFTFYQTAIAFSTDQCKDTFLQFDYALVIKENGIRKTDTNNITGQTATTIVFGGSIITAGVTMVEVIYYTEPLAKYNQLAA